MKPKTYMQNAYRAWCAETFPDYHVKDFPCSGRMYWTMGGRHGFAAIEYVQKTE